MCVILLLVHVFVCLRAYVLPYQCAVRTAVFACEYFLSCERWAGKLTLCNE